MADNVVANSGSGGATFATASGTWSGDTANFPGCFLAIVSGAEGSWTFAQVVGGAGAVAAGVQRMTLASDDPGVALLTTIDADTGSILTAVQLIDDAIYTDGTGTPSKGIAVMGTDGTNPQLVSVTASGHVNIADGGNTITVDNGGTFATQAAQSGTWNITNISGTISLPTGAATAAKQPALGTAGTASADVITIQGVASMTAIQVADNGTTLSVDDGAGSLTVDGTVAATQSGTWTVQPGNTAITTAWLVTGTGGTFPVTDSGGSLTVDNGGTFAVQPQAATSGGASALKVLDSDETEDEIKATAGQLYNLYCFNSTNAILYVKLYNATAANVTVGTTTPVMTIPVPGNNDTDGAGVVMTWPNGLAFDTAITIATTTGLADNDTGAPGANAMTLAGSYK